MSRDKNAALPRKDAEDLIALLKSRFEKHKKRHQGLEWTDVQHRLEKSPGKLFSLAQMEKTGGEPDVAGKDTKTGEYIFFDFSPESPQGRRSLCYDQEAFNARKENKPAGSATGMAEEMGIELLDEEQYRELQSLGTVDTKTSGWIRTPPEIRRLGGAVFAEHRYGCVFAYHNGAQSYYAARGFRGSLRV
jgi:hypothetical protein